MTPSSKSNSCFSLSKQIVYMNYFFQIIIEHVKVRIPASNKITKAIFHFFDSSKFLRDQIDTEVSLAYRVEFMSCLLANLHFWSIAREQSHLNNTI